MNYVLFHTSFTGAVKFFNLIIYFMAASQMAAYAIFSQKGGVLSDKDFFFFSAGMMIGQLGTGIECLVHHSIATLLVQIYFFGFTGYGAWVRFKGVKSKRRSLKEAQ